MGLYHPYWTENLKLALKLQEAVTAKYPTLVRPIALKRERYNQHLTRGSLILEVGSSGNTLQEALRAVRLFADSIGPTLTSLVERSF
jgi:stage II sporulation protein P